MPVEWLGDGPKPSRREEDAIRFEVRGELPPGEEMWIARLGHRWQILRVKGDTPKTWRGQYETKEDALDALRKELG